ncbi:MAG: ATP-binding protein [Saprospiraceae bacterium]|nr:ATP-binding protein [Saprospiraceae bacterium]
MTVTITFVQMDKHLQRVVITGPESAGKTTLAKELAVKYKVPWVPEFARTYLTIKHDPYQMSDLLYIARQQVLLEDVYLGLGAKWVICDTGLLNILLWSMEKYGEVDPWIRNFLPGRYDAYLLCTPDTAWQQDPLRENEHNRWDLYQLFYSYLESSDYPFVELDGPVFERVQKADAFLAAHDLRKS